VFTSTTVIAIIITIIAAAAGVADISTSSSLSPDRHECKEIKTDEEILGVFSQ
jgi:hypothetical protein